MEDQKLANRQDSYRKCTLFVKFSQATLLW